MIHANLICLENFISMQELEINTKVKNLFSLLQEGTLEEGELFFLAALRKIRKIPNLDDVTDEIEQEIFINSFHSDDYINNENIKFHWIYMLFFCKKLKDILSKKRNYLIFVILSQTEYGINFKMYKDRNTEYLLYLDSYSQPIIEIKF